jgi:hypothetical protein
MDSIIGVHQALTIATPSTNGCTIADSCRPAPACPVREHLYKVIRSLEREHRPADPQLPNYDLLAMPSSSISQMCELGNPLSSKRTDD